MPRQSNREPFADFNDLHHHFDTHLKTTRRTVAVGMIFSMLITLSVLGFLAWVIVKLMAHFGVV